MADKINSIKLIIMDKTPSCGTNEFFFQGNFKENVNWNFK